MDALVNSVGQLLDLSAEQIVLLVGLGGVLGFLAPRIWDLFKKRLERWVERSPLERDFPELNDRQLLDEFCKALRLHLDDLDEKSRWEHSRFVPLDAEVNVLRGERKRRRVMDLFAGIRAYGRAPLFLVIGDPGSGKSVALRKLSRKLLAQGAHAGKIPIYVNLREWSPAEPWSKDNPPSEEHLRAFLLHNVKDRVSLSLHAFLDQWLLKLLDRGRLFLIFDSFDEIPAVMDSEERSWMVQQLTSCIARMARSGGNGRAVLASRPFRRPRFSDEDRGRRPKLRHDVPVLELRPFSGFQIEAAIDHAAKDPDRPLRNPEAIKRALFSERPDLISIARTPFMLGLMIDFWQAQAGVMPASQAELYESFVQRSLRRAEDTMRECRLDNSAVLACTAAIAETMFESDRHGLDIPVTALAERLLNLRIEGVVAALRQARIARPSESATFSFIHRRFHEYFLIDHFGRNPDSLPYASIPHDTRWREGLVLFCEVADEPVARRIAKFCWDEIRKAREATVGMGSDAYRDALHSLRFLANAFRSRRDLIASFEPELAERIEKDVRDPDMLIAKHALEASGVLSDAAAQQTIAAALSSGNAWLMDTAFRGCRYLPAPSWKTRFLIMDRLLSISPVEHLRTYREIMLSLRHIEGMELAIWLYRLRHWDIVLFPIALVGFILLLHMSALMMIVFSIILLLILSLTIFDYHSNRIKKTIAKWRKDVLHIFSILFYPFFSDDVFSWALKDKTRFLSLSTFPIAIPVLVDFVVVIFTNNVGRIPEPFWAYLYKWLGADWFPYVAIVPCLLLMILLRPLTLALLVIRFCGRVVLLMVNYEERQKLFLAVLATLIIAAFSFSSILGIDMMKPELARFLLFIFGNNYVSYSALLLSVALIAILSVVSYRAMQERRAFKRATHQNPSRVQIHACFVGFATGRYRLKYVRWLEVNCDEAPKDAWPEGHPPNINKDDASIELAKLEERWLGLDQ